MEKICCHSTDIVVHGGKGYRGRQSRSLPRDSSHMGRLKSKGGHIHTCGPLYEAHYYALREEQ